MLSKEQCLNFRKEDFLSKIKIGELDGRDGSKVYFNLIDDAELVETLISKMIWAIENEFLKGKPVSVNDLSIMRDLFATVFCSYEFKDDSEDSDDFLNDDDGNATIH